jgi:hypothetical protein
MPEPDVQLLRHQDVQPVSRRTKPRHLTRRRGAPRVAGPTGHFVPLAGPQEASKQSAVLAATREASASSPVQTGERASVWHFAARPLAGSVVGHPVRHRGAIRRQAAPPAPMLRTPIRFAMSPPSGLQRHEASRSRPSSFARW